MNMEKWVNELFQEIKSAKMPNGLLIAFNQIYKEMNEVKLKIHEKTGMIEIRGNSNYHDVAAGKMVDLEAARRNEGGEVAGLFAELAILEDAEKEFQKLLIRTELKPSLISDIKIIYGSCFSVEVTKREVFKKLNVNLEKILRVSNEPDPDSVEHLNPPA